MDTSLRSGGEEKAPLVVKGERQVVAKPWLTVKETAEVLEMSVNTIYAAIETGQFPFEWKRVGRQIRVSAKSLGLGCGEETGQ
ncbi:MAG TPA: helix-turn-helix domain-containing protein [Blastocatellia bacterium]|nr:helix-turn-helix domain-containing protein [Blastocatellia bacterium]